MGNEIGFSKQEFIDVWGQAGYIEDFYSYQSGHLEDVLDILSEYYNPNHICMDIGCGGGLWTKKYLSPNFKKIIAIDVLSKDSLSLSDNIEYIELDDRDYNCTGVEDESIDFAVSFGVFCHFPNSASQTYINSIYNKLKPGGTGLIMFSDFHRHFEHSRRHFNAKEALLDLLTGGTRSKKTKLTSSAIVDNAQELASDKNVQDKYRENDSCGGWFWYDMDTVNGIFENSNFLKYEDVTPDGFRDCLMAFSKA